MELTQIAKHFDVRGESAIADMEKIEERAHYEKRLQNPLAAGLYSYIEKQIPIPTAPGARFLDLCCGTGGFSIYPAYLGYQIEGVDISEKSVAAARLRISRHGFNEAVERFVHADALKYLDGAFEKYDVIQCMASFYYLKETDILDKISKALKPGGVFIGVETNGMNPFSSMLRRWKHKRFKHRDTATLNHLLTGKDFERMSCHFSTFDITPLDCFSFLGLVGQGRFQMSGAFFKSGQAVDRLLFALPGADRLAFRIGYLGRK